MLVACHLVDQHFLTPRISVYEKRNTNPSFSFQREVSFPSAWYVIASLMKRKCSTNFDATETFEKIKPKTFNGKAYCLHKSADA